MSVGIVCVVWMLCVLVFYAECVGFVVEAFIMTLMGAVVNAGSAANYVMLGFWTLTYSIACFNDSYNRYMELNSKIFELLRAKLEESVKQLTSVREQHQKRVAFKYFNQTDLDREADLERDMMAGEGQQALVISPERSAPAEDTIERDEGKLFWNIKHLVLFVNSDDEQYIPRKLFDAVCNIRAPGCPGPVYRGLMRATGRFMYMVVFLLFVALVVLAFGNLYNVSSTNQLLVTLAGGFLPFVIRFVLQPGGRLQQDLSTCAFAGKFHDLLRDFCQLWPLHDLTFTLDTNVEQDIPANAAGGVDEQAGSDDAERRGGSSQPIARNVDLMITIRDEDDDENLVRSSPGSCGSLNSSPRVTQDVSLTSQRLRLLQPTRMISQRAAERKARSAMEGGDRDEIPLTTFNRFRPANTVSPIGAGDAPAADDPLSAHAEDSLTEAEKQMRDDVTTASDEEGSGSGAAAVEADESPIVRPKVYKMKPEDAQTSDETTYML